jgi:single-strand DNA-binding protein
MNIVKLGGHLGKDPEIRYLPDGNMVVNVSLATSNDYKPRDSDEWIKKPASWHNLVAFGKTAEELSGFKKGNKLQVEGKITYESWTDKDGNKRYATKIQVFNIVSQTDNKSYSIEADDVPF